MVGIPSVCVNHLSVFYPSGLALRDVTVKFFPGTMYCISGPNGSGKTTLLDAISGSGRVKISSGTVDVAGGADSIAYVPQCQRIDLNFPISAIEVAMMGRYQKLRGLKWYKKRDKEIAVEVLERLGIKALMDRRIGELSVGQRNRLFISRALIKGGDVFLLDEPLSGIDKATEIVLMKIFHELAKSGKTLIVVHHDLNSIPTYFDKMLLLNTKIIATGTTKDVLTRENIEKAYGYNVKLAVG